MMRALRQSRRPALQQPCRRVLGGPHDHAAARESRRQRRAADVGAGWLVVRAASSTASSGPGSVDPAEVEKFGRIAARWWEPDGPMAGLHQMQPVRMQYIKHALLSQPAVRAATPCPV